LIPAVWRQQGHLVTKILHLFPFIQYGMSSKEGRSGGMVAGCSRGDV